MKMPGPVAAVIAKADTFGELHPRLLAGLLILAGAVLIIGAATWHPDGQPNQ